MHSPKAAMANTARTALEQLYAKFLRHICGVRFNTPPSMLLTELALSPLKVFWWQQSLQFYNRLATSPADSFFHMILLDNQYDAFCCGTRNFTKSVFQGLTSVGYDMSTDAYVASVLDVPAIIELLQHTLQDPM